MLTAKEAIERTRDIAVRKVKSAFVADQDTVEAFIMYAIQSGERSTSVPIGLQSSEGNQIARINANAIRKILTDAGYQVRFGLGLFVKW